VPEIPDSRLRGNDKILASSYNLELLKFSYSNLELLNLLYSDPFEDSDDLGETEMFFAGGPSWLTNILGADIFRTVTLMQCNAPGNSFSYGADDDGNIFVDRTYKCGLAKEDLKSVGQLRYLRFLSLEANPVTDEGVVHLEKLSRLETLNLSNTAITDRSLNVLIKLPKLRDLDVSGTNISADGVKTLQKRLSDCEIKR